MSAPFDIIALITPKPGKADRVTSSFYIDIVRLLTVKKVVELLQIAAAAVKANEPGTLRYHVHREIKGDAPTIVMLETYVLPSQIMVYAN